MVDSQEELVVLEDFQEVVSQEEEEEVLEADNKNNSKTYFQREDQLANLGSQNSPPRCVVATIRAFGVLYNTNALTLLSVK